MAHFSKFIWPGSVRIHTNLHAPSKGILALAFQRPDKRIVVLICNLLNQSGPMTIKDKSGARVNFYLKKKSINTLVYSIEHGQSQSRPKRKHKKHQ